MRGFTQPLTRGKSALPKLLSYMFGAVPFEDAAFLLAGKVERYEFEGIHSVLALLRDTNDLVDGGITFQYTAQTILAHGAG